ncbi:MAG: phosphoribosyl-AMP cyclohydrolase [Oscillospiraceae bacterium]|jgi:phosphoribosyl-AMP cyclohydrolase|nr:phosphoribosyl-AMP cyclohydrolase [Oscillospiraceae bacterium]
MQSIEEATELRLDFEKLDAVRGALPVAVQDAKTREVLLIAYTNAEALRETLRLRQLVLYSTSRGRLWYKGAEESGNAFRVEEIRVNCEQNSLVYLVTPLGGGICHTQNAEGKHRNCYYRRLNMDRGGLEFIVG